VYVISLTCLLDSCKMRTEYDIILLVVAQFARQKQNWWNKCFSLAILTIFHIEEISDGFELWPFSMSNRVAFHSN